MPPRLAVALAALLAVLPAAAFAQATASSPSSDGTTVVITGQGVVQRPPDMATVSSSIATNDDVAATATAKNNAIYNALVAALAQLHIDAADIKSTFYNVSYNPRPVPSPAPLGATPPSPLIGTILQSYPYPYPGARYGYLVNRQLSISVAHVSDVGAVIDAAVKAGVTNIGGVQYSLKDRSAANEAALALALGDAANQAKVVASASHLRLGGIKQIQVGQQYSGGPAPMPMRVMQDGMAPVPTQIAPSAIDVRASVTVTYVLKP
jgi:uncharacterized protein YggE